MADEGNIHYLNPKNKTLEDTLLEIANVIKDDPNSNSSPQPQSNINNIHGNNNIVGNGNTVVTFNNPVTRNTKKVEVKTGDGVLDASEKAQVQNLVRQWVSDNNAVKINKKLTMAMAWSILNKKMKVNSYHEIKSEAFDQAIKWLRSQIGMINGMKSAPKKISDWRPGRIKAIQARCSERGWQDWRKDYMQKKFNKSSMKELTDVELEQLYKTVFGKK